MALGADRNSVYQLVLKVAVWLTAARHHVAITAEDGRNPATPAIPARGDG
jgi:hypothetical protein